MWSSSIRGDFVTDVMVGSGRSAGQPRITVLVCTLNEAGNLRHVLPRIPSWVDEVLIVDGHSVDHTRAEAVRLRSEVRVVLQPGRGKGDALRYGIDQAAGDIIVTLDADGQTDPGELQKFVQALQQGYDVAKGTRFLKPFDSSRPMHRLLGNWIITILFNFLFKRHFTDICSGYNAFRTEAIRNVDLSFSDGLADEPLLHARICKAGLRVVEVPHRDLPRLEGRSKAPSWRQGSKAIKTILIERVTG